MLRVGALIVTVGCSLVAASKCTDCTSSSNGFFCAVSDSCSDSLEMCSLLCGGNSGPGCIASPSMCPSPEVEKCDKCLATPGMGFCATDGRCLSSSGSSTCAEYCGVKFGNDCVYDIGNCAAAGPSPTANPSPSPTAAPSPSPTAAPSPSPTAAPSPSPTSAPSPSPTSGPTSRADCIKCVDSGPMSWCPSDGTCLATSAGSSCAEYCAIKFRGESCYSSEADCEQVPSGVMSKVIEK